ncbi:pre-mRNA-splicing factor CWC2 [Cryptococcus depauperatus CBS 7841]|uniref:Pre-mRNA-splicing factor CWC2 n=1 Tax=Cryptococcus depauperatus CBS 7841 TaxID=1295531 RepID=A0A1E3IZX8_9TREE|nr:pre-mRNA-splicing factor CWC2 [Cryptococcus depauperatus CBS 7841]ODO00496.1 pre-mRNA-splicing factor CWC2 [Cryptococcus depauperatus CBS 7855]
MSSDTQVAPKRKLRPARKQVASDEVDKSQGYQAGREYNIWYNKWAGGDREDALASKVHSQTRCIIARDAGYTRADATGNKYCCLFFARGCCPYGHECQYLHRLPLPSHQLLDHSRDCFGREKHAEYRDDMGGVGTFNRQNRTLYIGKIAESPDKKQMTETMLRHFGEWGKIIKHNILFGRGVGFVTYETEQQASFAKEAMANQSMDGDEILNVRWATEDPNPGEKVAEQKRIEEMGQAAITSMLDEGLVEATQAVRALEEGDVEDLYPIFLPSPPAENGMDDMETAERPTKKAKGQGGLLGEEALDNIKFYAEVAKKQAEERIKARKVPAKQHGIALLGGYGSGDESS